MQLKNAAAQQTDQQSAWKLARRLLWFLSPLLLIALVTELSLWKTGETWPAIYAVRQQQIAAEETIYCRDFLSQQFGVYKFATIKRRNPEIVAIGSSRVMQIRDFMFSPLQESFYNAGGMTQSVTELGEYVELLEQDKLPNPKVAIIGIDPWWLKSEYHRDKSWLAQQDEAFQFASHINALKRIVRQNRFSELYTAVTHSDRSPFFGYRCIGTAASKYGSGFRKDGSWQYSPQIILELAQQQQYVDREVPPIIDRIHSHFGNFSAPATWDEEKSARLLSLIQRLQTRGTEVLVVMPPYSSDCIHSLSVDADLKQWWDAYQQGFVDTLRVHGITVLPASDPSQYGLDDTYMIDGYHPGEVFMGHIVLELLRSAPQESLLQQVNAQALRAKLDSAFSPLGFAAPQRHSPRVTMRSPSR
ncbi:hypothetical protein RMSM_07003 [Rhodopirellula maiorica SM1]|uniref:Uncharacterized protein n=1 Tax=Rhodopirellula maiorica SM1 TaxID=1265738 RepID=M5R9M5_9BACT|nr:SGNH/GDSL hydrolase family protein [Rhodopirellula maiorica]EMI16080.1 hypothetical protein RMSM_07003 [Rhodopirellula maiorica SM1]